MRNDFIKRIKLEKREDKELTPEEISAMQNMATQETYKGSKCINVPELYLQEEDYGRIYDEVVGKVLNSIEKDGEEK